MIFNIKKLALIFIIFPFIIKESILYKYYKFCLKCINANANSSKCVKCPNDFIFKNLKIMSDDITLKEIIKKNKSISRFGDGEFKIIFGRSNGFQKANKILSKKLLNVLNLKDKDFLVGINLPYKKKEFKKRTSYAQKYWNNFFNKYKYKLAKIIKNKKYYSATISRFYMDYKDKIDKINIQNYIQKLKKIWEQKDILFIEGEKSRLGIGNDLFNNCKSIKRIICPAINAFKVYGKIIKAVLEYGKNRLILIALGPTATILAYDLYKLGYQSIDIGHVDIEYEWFLRNATDKIQIENKYVNEACGKRYIFKDVKDNNYYNQIVTRIIQ